MNTFIVNSADLITKTGTEAFVGLTVTINGKQEQIARSCKQALLDMHKSARASSIPADLFENGVSSANPLMVNQFRNAVIGLVNKAGFAELSFHEAGDTYVAIAESSAVRAGEAQVGDTLNFLKKGSRVEGFLTFPLTDLELAQRAFLDTANPLLIMQGLFGITAPAPVVTPDPIRNLDAGKSIEDEMEKEVFGADFESPEDEIEEEEAPAPIITAKKAK
jgi:hypothetical protein